LTKRTLGNVKDACCASRLQAELQAMPGVRTAQVRFSGHGAMLHLDADDPDAVLAAIPAIVPGAYVAPKGARSETESQGPPVRREVTIIVASVLLFGAGLGVGSRAEPGPSWQVAYYALVLGAYLLSGAWLLRSAARSVVCRRVLDETFLMAIATIGALAIGDVAEAAGVTIFYRVGQLLEDLAVRRSRRALKSLLAIRPDYANVRRNGVEATKPPDQVAVGEEVVVRPGERIPLDGVVLDGHSTIDRSMMTGEPVPRSARPGDEVFAGTVNVTGAVVIRVTRPASESSAARILDLVENASARKAPTERFITRFARCYTPGIVVLTLGIALIPPLVIPGASLADWFHRGLVILVVSCPCALLLSVPLGYFGGVGGASRSGILVKGANYLDTLANTRTVVFDKTGTLTKGVFKVTAIEPRDGVGEPELLRAAAMAETHSIHPIAQSLREAHALRYGPWDRLRMSGEHAGGTAAPASASVAGYEEMQGRGVRAVVEGREVVACSHRYLHDADIPHDRCDEAATDVHVVVDGRWTGRIVISDEVKSDAGLGVGALRSLGVRTIGMLTGDQPDTAARVSAELGLDFAHGGLLPAGKLAAVEAMLAQHQGRNGGRLAFVGDGTNDAPVLARADVGIAMGALGSDAALEAADVVITTDSVARVADAIRLARRTRSIVWQNIVLALGLKGLVLVLGIAGVASMAAAVFADVGVAVLAVLNSTRVLKSVGVLPAGSGPNERESGVDRS